MKNGIPIKKTRRTSLMKSSLRDLMLSTNQESQEIKFNEIECTGINVE